MWNQQQLQPVSAGGSVFPASPIAGASGMPPAAPPLSPQQVVQTLERGRRQRLMRVLALGEVTLALLLVPAIVYPELDWTTLLAVLAAILSGALAYLLNRTGLTAVAGYAFLGGLALAIALQIGGNTLKQHGLDLNDLRLYDFFLMPIAFSAVLANRRVPFLIAGVTISFTFLSLLLLPKTPELQAYWDGTYAHAPGSFYDVLAVPQVIQALTAITAYLGADSVLRALREATRADALALANEQILAQSRAIELQRRRLHDAMAHVRLVSAAFGRGHFEARVRLGDGELLPLAWSLNTLFDRLQSLLRVHAQRAQMDQALQELVMALRQVRAGHPYRPPNYTGTPFDGVLLELAALLLQPGIAVPSGGRGGQGSAGQGSAWGAVGPVGGSAPGRQPGGGSSGTGEASTPRWSPHAADATPGTTPGSSMPAGPHDVGDDLPFWLRSDGG